ncbi:MAG TPA: aldo/keto reductase [Spirochaetia bacterium]|nr:aldo/keto reductase [Spirochaetia bacterium]
MEKRRLGNTGLELSVLGFGGFHLVEIDASEAAHLLGAYLDAGGTYIETAASYGDGISETKIGRAVSHRRASFFLATKSTQRSRAGFAAELDQSLRNLKTDHVDVIFIHALQTKAEAEQVLAPGGALEAATEAKKNGKARFIAVSFHGRPDGGLFALARFPFDVLMTGFNYFDRFNYPSVEGTLLPGCQEKGVGVLAMKSLADGYLFRSPAPAFRYTLSLPVASVVAGINSRKMLETDLRLVSTFTPMTEAEKETLFRTAPELGDYVCRLCGKCKVNGFDPQSVFLLEGLFDRQMDDMRVTDASLYALRERLRTWFQQQELARDEYEKLPQKVDPQRDYSSLSPLCPYGIDIDRKLKIAHGKLSRERYIA